MKYQKPSPHRDLWMFLVLALLGTFVVFDPITKFTKPLSTSDLASLLLGCMLTIVDLSPRFFLLFCFHWSTTSTSAVSIRSGDAGAAPDVTTFAAGSCRAPWAVAAEQLQMLRQQGLEQDVTWPHGRIARRKLDKIGILSCDAVIFIQPGWDLTLVLLANRQYGSVPFRDFVNGLWQKGKSTISGCESNKFFDVRMAKPVQIHIPGWIELLQLHVFFWHG